MPDTNATRLTVVLEGSSQHDPDHEPLEDELYVEVATEAQIAVMHYAIMQAMELIQASGYLLDVEE